MKSNMTRGSLDDAKRLELTLVSHSDKHWGKHLVDSKDENWDDWRAAPVAVHWDVYSVAD